MLSSAAGSVFDYGMLMLIGEEAPEVIAAAITRAVQEEYIVPADHKYAIFSATLAESGREAAQMGIRLKFAHDRIQQAFYQLLDPERGRGFILVSAGCCCGISERRKSRTSWSISPPISIKGWS